MKTKELLILMLGAVGFWGCAHVHTVPAWKQNEAISEITEGSNDHSLLLETNDRTTVKGYHIALMNDTVSMYGKNMNKTDDILLSNINSISFMSREKGITDGIKIGFITGAVLTAVFLMSSENFNGEEKLKIVLPGMLIYGAVGAFVGAITGYGIGGEEKYLFQH
jgi:hypothetical protein